MRGSSTTREADVEARNACARGLEWLRVATGDFREFPPAPIGLYFARLWYTEQLYPVLLTVDACAAIPSATRA